MTGARTSDGVAGRPGWATLREAADELHAAELLIGDPIASPATAVPHLVRCWRALLAAVAEAGLGPTAGADASLRAAAAWLEGEPARLAALDSKTRTRLLALLDELDRASAGPAPSKRALRAQAAGARALLAVVEPEVGGVPLHRRRRRTLAAVAGAAIVTLPVLIYAAVHAEVPGTGPWRAGYYADKEFDDDPVLVREDTIDHDWDDTAPHEKIAPDKFSVRWDTCLVVDEAGPVVFQVKANEGARVIVDGETVIDAWDKDAKTKRRGFGSGELELTAGVHHLRVEYYESMGDAYIELVASLAGEVPGPLPRERLRYPGDELDEQDPCAAVR